MNIITARTQRDQTRRRLLDRVDHSDYTLYEKAETEYYRQVDIIRNAAIALFVIGGSALALFGIFRSDNPALFGVFRSDNLAYIGIALALIGLVQTVIAAVERECVPSRKQERINETLAAMLDNEETRRH